MKPALLLIDLQEDYLQESSRILPPRELLVRRAALLLEGFRRLQQPVIHVWTTLGADDGPGFAHWRKNGLRKCVSGTTGHRPPARLRPVPGEAVVHKHGFSAFTGSDLEACLARTGADTVVLAGLHLHACVRTAAVECLERRYSVILAEDAVGSNAPIHSAATEHWLAERCATFLPVADCLELLEARNTHPSGARAPWEAVGVAAAVEVARADAVAAIELARQRQVPWAAEPLASRGAQLARLATWLRVRASALATQMARDIGKPVAHGLEEVERAAATVEAVIRWDQDARRAKPPGTAVRRRPLGAVAVVTPWNNPLALPIGKITPALLYGNAVLWKPAPAGVSIARELMKILTEAGLAPGLVQVLEGGAATARRLASLEGIDAVTITGSWRAGYALQEICASRSVPLQAELGGNNAAILWEESDPDEAAAQVVWGAFAFAGQRCTANRRVILPEDRVGQFLEAAGRAGRALRWGDPLDPATQIGPLISRARCEDMEWLLADAQAHGAVRTVVHPHPAPDAGSSLASGTYARPTIAVCRQPSHALVQEELMAPVLVVQPASDFDHALALCNGVRQGLAAALFSESEPLQRRFLDETQAGILKLNTSTAGADPCLPFGGWKASGLGPPEHGEGDALFYQRWQACYGIPAPE